MNRQEIITYIMSQKKALEEEYSVTKIGLFGSFARDEVFENSDIDICVELANPDLFSLIGIKQKFQEAFNIPVDIVRLRKNMNEQLRKRIMKDALFV